MPRPLAAVRAHVRVTLNDGIDSSAPFIAKLKALGARASARFQEDATHLVWRGAPDALSSTLTRYRDAKARVVVVSPLWITACERAGARVDAAPYVVRAPPSGTPSAASKFSRTSTTSTATAAAVAVKLGKRPREVEVVDIARYSSASRLELEAMAASVEASVEASKRTFAEVVVEGRDAKRQKPADDVVKNDDGGDEAKENAAPDAAPAATKRTWADVVVAKVDAACPRPAAAAPSAEKR